MAEKNNQKKKPAPKPRLKPGNWFASLGAGINQWLPFEAVNRAVAGGSAVLGRGDYQNNLRRIQAQQEVDREANPTAYWIGAIPSLVLGGMGLARGTVAGGQALAKVGGTTGKVGRAVAASQTLRQGERAKNIGKLAASGGTFAAAEEAVRGGDAGDVATAATIGAAASPAASGALDVVGYAARPLVDLVRSKNYGQILRRITTATPDELQAARADYKAKTGAEPTLFEILPKGDRDKIGSMVIRNSPNLQEQAAAGIRSRAANVEPEMRASVQRATRGRIGSIEQSLADDLAMSRGGTAVPEDVLMAREAAGSTAGAAKLREAEARNIMAPFDDQTAYTSINDMLPQSPSVGTNGTIQWGIADQEAATLINRAASTLRVADNITVKNVGDIRRSLQKMVDRNDVSSDAAQRAINHIDDILERDLPDAAAAMQQMRDAYAGRSRMIEGMGEGARTRTAEKFPVSDASDLNTYRNIYETPEGGAGRAAGQTNRLLQDFAGTPDEAIAATGRLAEDTAALRAIEANVGGREAAQLSEAAQAQSESLRRLAELRGKTKGDVAEADLRNLGDVLLAFNPGSFAMTRMAALSRLMRLTKFGEKKSAFLIDKLFSQDPQKIEQGLKLFDRMGGPGRQFLGELAHSLSLNAARTGPALVELDKGLEDAEIADDYSQMSDEELMNLIGEQPQGEPDYSQMSDEELMNLIGPQAEASPYAGQTDAYAPEFQDLFSRLLRQESGTRQFDENGNPRQSSAGAIGIAQVMPGTAPEAAQMAGLPWDEQAYYTDEEYNKALGAAYLNEMLRTFQGNPALALAAYNAGPGAVQRAIARGQQNWFSYLPEETQGYLQAILQ